MAVHVLYHGRCFDGASSAALFADFYRRHIDGTAEFKFIAKSHRTGDPYDPDDFSGDKHAIVDFRYTQDPALTWYFDHHRSAFQLPGDRAHYEADRSEKRFHDPLAPCCASYMSEQLARHHGYDPTPHANLIRWATIIDTANFATPHVAVDLAEPAMQLAAYIQSADDPETIATFIEDLLVKDFAHLASAPYVQTIVRPRLRAHARDMRLIRSVSRIEAGALEYDLLDAGPRVLSHFIPYVHHPDVRYVVGLYEHPDGDLRLTVGYNPWLSAEDREHDLAELCERSGGGGHPQVAGISLSLEDRSLARKTAGSILEILRSPAPNP